MIDRASLDLFRRHVGGRTQHSADLRASRGSQRGVRGRARTFRRERFGETEVEHLDAAIASHHDVAGLYIAVDDPPVVRRRERIGQRRGDRDHLLDGKATGWNQPVQPLPLDDLHRQKVHATVFFDGVHRDNVRVIEGGGGPGLALEARKAFRIARHVGGQHLDGDVAPELPVAGAIHLAHSAFAKFGDDAIWSECIPDVHRVLKPGFGETSL